MQFRTWAAGKSLGQWRHHWIIQKRIGRTVLFTRLRHFLVFLFFFLLKNPEKYHKKIIKKWDDKRGGGALKSFIMAIIIGQHRRQRRQVAADGADGSIGSCRGCNWITFTLSHNASVLPLSLHPSIQWLHSNRIFTWFFFRIF